VSEPLGEIDELEDGRVRVGAGVDELVRRQPQNFANDRRNVRVHDERLQMPIERAAHLDRAVGQLGGKRAIPFVEPGSPRAIIERCLRGSLRGVSAGRGKNVAHHRER
jgi:hypothetical protein